jgi:hypothetical protein
MKMLSDLRTAGCRSLARLLVRVKIAGRCNHMQSLAAYSRISLKLFMGQTCVVLRSCRASPKVHHPNFLFRVRGHCSQPFTESRLPLGWNKGFLGRSS